MKNIEFDNCDEIFDRQYYLYADRALSNIDIISKRSNYEEE
jgi:hypothetical protein